MLTERKKDNNLFEAMAAINEHYEINYDEVAEHFNTLSTLKVHLYQRARRFVKYCEVELDVRPDSPDFSEEFIQITATPVPPGANR